MAILRILFCALLLGCPLLALGHAQDPGSGAVSSAVSSDDIGVADGLQLPSYGHAWVLDTWEGVKELVELHPAASRDHGISLKLHRTVDLKGEGATVCSHDPAPQIFVRGVNSDDSGTARSGFVILRLKVAGGRRQSSKDSSEEIAAMAKGKTATSADIIEPKQERVGDTNWYRLSLAQPLDPGEYALVPLPGSPAAALNEIYDFAVDPRAPENLQPLRSERDRRSNP